MRINTWIVAAGLVVGGVAPALAGDRDARDPPGGRAAQAERPGISGDDLLAAREDAEERRVLARRTRFYSGLDRLRGGGARIDPFPAPGNASRRGN